MPATDAWLSPAEVAARLGISLATLNRWVTAGQAPPSYKLGAKSRRFSEAELEAWLAEQQAAAK